jgi:ribose 5-phosphate isomerase B
MSLPDKISTIHLASDHAGFEHKEVVREWLSGLGFAVVDHGAKVYEAGDDFPDFIKLAAAAVNENPENSCGIIFGGSGQGEAMVANSYPKVRATVYYGGNKEIIKLSKEHNDANILSIGARFVSIDETKEVIWEWLHESVLEDEKYQRRNQKIQIINQEIYHL